MQLIYSRKPKFTFKPFIMKNFKDLFCIERLNNLQFSKFIPTTVLITNNAVRLFFDELRLLFGSLT